MAKKRIELVRTDFCDLKVYIIYNDGSRGEIDMTKAKGSMFDAVGIVGLTLKQAKMRLGIKD